MNKLLREHAARRAYQDATEPVPDWMRPPAWDDGRKPLRALNCRVRPKVRRRLPRHTPLGATLLRRIRAKPHLVQTAAAAAALDALGAGQ